MAAFPDDPIFLSNRLDWAILRNGWSTLYCKQAVLETDLVWFRKEDFEIIDIDCSDWDTPESIHESLSRNLSFPGYYGYNLDALNDSLSNVQISTAGLIVVLRNFHLAEADIRQKIVDIFANNSRRHILFGRKLILLLQVDSRDFDVADVGSCPVPWNNAEFSRSKK